MLRKWGLLACDVNRTGTLRWGDGSEVAYQVTTRHARGTLRLLYSSGAPPTAHDYAVRLEAPPCRYGWWLRCPLSRAGVACGARVRKLYLRGRWFGCRKCHGLVYRSSQESDSRVDALARASLGVARSERHVWRATRTGAEGAQGDRTADETLFVLMG